MMKALTHITAGRTAIRALLVVVVLTAGIAGTVGTAVAEPIGGMGDDPFPSGLFASLDGTGDDAVTYAFPINNATASVDSSTAPLAQLDPATLAGVVGSDHISLVDLGQAVFPVASTGSGGGSGKPSLQ